jgi:5'-methylthioadenosine phosphorylase
MAMVTDYDCWKKESKAVCVNTVTATFAENLAVATAIIKDLVPKIPPKRQCLCSRSLEGAIMTQTDRISPDTRHCLGPIINKFLTS